MTLDRDVCWMNESIDILSSKLNYEHMVREHEILLD